MTGIGGEASRKSIHLLVSLGVAALVWRLPPVHAASVLAAATGVALAIEALRLSSDRFRAAFIARFGPMLRDAETARLSGATSLALGYTLAAVLLPGRPALAAVLIVGIADALAAVIGRRWGRHRYPGGKSVEGSAAFFVVTLGICHLLGAALPGAVMAAAALTLVESATLRLDDNLYLPVVAAAVFAGVAGLWG